MKKITGIIIGLFCALSLSAQTTIPFSFIKSSSGYDPDAQALFDMNARNDYDPAFKTIWSNRVKAMKANGTWASSIGGFPFIPTSSISEPLRNARTLVLNANYIGVNSSDTTDIFITNQAYVASEGLGFNANLTTVGVGAMRTGIVPSATMTLNNSAIAIGCTRDESGATGYNMGVFQATSQSILFMSRSTGNLAFGDMYGGTLGTGRIQQTGADGAKGCYILSRVSSTDFKIYKNGTSIGSSTSTQGTLPTQEFYLGRFNGSGTSRNKPIAYFWVYGSGLTPAQVAQETADWNTFASAMGRYNTVTHNIVLDGNSHTVLFRAAYCRSISDTNALTYVAKYHFIGISGQSTTSCLANASVNVDPLYDASVSKNIYVCWEATNDISSGISIDSVKARYQRLCAGRRAVGFKVLAMPAMCRDYSGDTTKIMNTYYFNEFLAANWSTFADDVVDPNEGVLANNFYIKRSAYANTTAYKNAVLLLTDNAALFVDAATHLTERGYYDYWGKTVAIHIRNMSVVIIAFPLRRRKRKQRSYGMAA